MESPRSPSNLIRASTPNEKSERGLQLTKVRVLDQTLGSDFVTFFFPDCAHCNWQAPGTGTVNPADESSTAKSNPNRRSLLKKYTVKLASASSVSPLSIDLHIGYISMFLIR